MRLLVTFTILAILVLPSAAVSASVLEDQLESELRGAWAVLSVEIFSDCAGYYNNNEMHGAGVASKADRRFERGELVKIDKINLKRSRIDLFLSLSEPVLMSRVEGPFELFDERRCKVQLMVDVPRERVKQGDRQGILDQLAAFMVTAPSMTAAQEADEWNERERKPFPENYETTLARYEVWKAEQYNVALRKRNAKAHSDAVYVTARIREDAEYLKGFGAGAVKMAEWDEDDCEDLVDASFAAEQDRAPSSESRMWKDGFNDGQKLVFNVLLADRLQGCYRPVPPSPGFD